MAISYTKLSPSKVSVHPLCVSYLHRGSSIVGLRLICLSQSKNYFNQLLSFRKTVTKEKWWTVSDDVLVDFSKEFYVRLVCFDIHTADVELLLEKVQFSDKDLCTSEEGYLTSNLMDMPPVVFALNEEDTALFGGYLRVLIPQNRFLVEPLRTDIVETDGFEQSDRVEQISLKCLGIDQSDFTQKIVYKNEEPIAYISTGIQSILNKATITQEGNILKFSNARQGFILCVGKQRHMPVIIGTQLSIDMSTGLVTLYRGILQNTKFRAKYLVFDRGAFAWVLNSSKDIDNVCGVKYQEK